jgi:hypothetical protein
MPNDISEDIYRYLSRDWGHSKDTLRTPKITQLKRDIPDLRKRYEAERRIPYNRPGVRRAYLASFAARYASVLYGCLNLARAEALETLGPWHQSDAVVCLIGGGPACELVGLLDWLYENNIKPKHLHAVILDREGFWRSFHSFLFVEIIGSRFRKTQILPSYEAVEFPVSKKKSFKREAVDYGFQQPSLLAEARLISIINFMSEISDHRGLECHLRFLTCLAWERQLVVCADSSANKRRNRMDWLQNHFEKPTSARARQIHAGVQNFDCPWLQQMSTTSQRIFNRTSKPLWLHSFKRWVYIAQTRP